MKVNWTPGPGPAPLPYSKKYRDSLNIPDKDLPSWHFPDDPLVGASRKTLLLSAAALSVALAAAIWYVYCKLKSRAVYPRHATIVAHVPGSSGVKADERDIVEAREARLKRYEEAAAAEAAERRKVTYAQAMAEAMAGTSKAKDV